MKECKNGHYYNPDTHKYCPYCPQPDGEVEDNDAKKTDMFDGKNDADKTDMFDGQNEQDDAGKTDMFDNKNQNPHNKTQLFGEGDDSGTPPETDMFDKNIPENKRDNNSGANENNWNKTFIGVDPSDFDDPAPGVQKEAPRAQRKLVGWLVSYTIDDLGIDFRLYEGKNLIGSAPANEITIPNDKLVSSTHATILFRKNKFRLKDEFSTNGTYLNGEDLDDEVLVLNDGDVIRVGDTLLKFRSAL